MNKSPPEAGHCASVLKGDMNGNQRNTDLIVTDLGGTLVGTDGAIMAAVRRAAKELGIPEGYADPVYDVFGTSIWECMFGPICPRGTRTGPTSATSDSGGCFPTRCSVRSRRLEIAIKEGLDNGSRSEVAYYKLAKECDGNCREMLQRIEAGWALCGGHKAEGMAETEPV